MDDSPNINRIVSALTEGGLKGTYTESGFGMDVSEAFLQFVLEEDFGDDGMEDEFGDGRRDESFFIDWLKEEKGVEESKANAIWDDLNKAFKGKYDNNTNNSDVKENIVAPEGDNDDRYKNYNIVVSNENLKRVEKLLSMQCNDLRVKSESNVMDTDRATYSILQIGKQNKNQPLLMYLVDAYNRYRVQRRKRLKRRYPDPVVYNVRFSDPEPVKFINEKCRGFDKWLKEYTNNQIQQFKDMCQSSISVFFRRLLHKPPMAARTAVIDDSIIHMGFYIFQSYSFIQQFVEQKSSPLPSQIDVVILPKKIKMMGWNSDYDVDSDYDEDDETKNDMDEVDTVDVGDINIRLKAQQNKIGGIPIEWGTANRTMLQSTNTILLNKRYQRAIIIIDRRDNKKDDSDKDPKKDKCYGYTPNKDKKCHCFESDEYKFLCEALMQNSRLCLLPKIESDKNELADIGINTQIPSCLTLSFHCFSSTEVRVYLCYNGWGTRFFIQDIKYFLPQFFVHKQQQILRNAFEKDRDRSFANKYEATKGKCMDVKFDTFYKALIDGKNPY